MSEHTLAGGGGHVPLAVTTRSGVDESVHFGSVIVIDGDGRELFSAGTPSLGLYPRSALKPVQASAMLAGGLDVSDEQLALVCASHDGTDRHCDVVLSILSNAGLDETSLGNSAGLPIDDNAAAALIREGGAANPLRMNCSGKHAGMLATCVSNGWTTDDYLEPEHPLQSCVTEEVARRAGGVRHVGVDGCGAPAHYVGIGGVAAAFAGIAAEAGRVHRAMTAHPELVGGERRFVTRLMRSVPGLLAKDGAEGVFVAALPDGRALAVKVADGSHRPVPAVTIAALAMLGVDVTDQASRMSPPVLGRNRPVGAVRALLDGTRRGG